MLWIADSSAAADRGAASEVRAPEMAGFRRKSAIRLGKSEVPPALDPLFRVNPR